jgi:DNA-directed RNA polymerase subunit RPC12/RpoP
MAVAQGSCPNCGAPIEFGVGSSIAKVCEYCRHTVLRSDRGLENLGKAADLAHTPSLIAVGDEGTLGGRPFRVMGRVQLDHGAGPWDEYYVALDFGQSWGWLAYAQGQWHATSLAPAATLPAYRELQPELDVSLGPAGAYRVAEVKSATLFATEGELPGLLRAGQTRYYADCYGLNRAFATIDYGDGSGAPALFVGFVFDEPALEVTALGPRSLHKVKTQVLKCPNCGGDVPSLSGERAERLGCPYCGAVSDIAAARVIAQQEAARRKPAIPIGTRGVLEGVEYVVTAYLRRGSTFEGERYTWQEYLLFAQRLGFRWLVKDPETGWSWVEPVNLAELDLGHAPERVGYAGRTFTLRNENTASVEYVLGEVYWKCELGEATRVRDYVQGGEVLSREASVGEVRWSLSKPVEWSWIAAGLGLPPDGPGAHRGGKFSGGSAGSNAFVALVVVLFILLLCAMNACESCRDLGTAPALAPRGGGIFYGGK